MQLRPLGRTGLHVSPIGFGAWQLANPLWGGPGRLRLPPTRARCARRGLQFLRHRPAYGDGASERLLGEALRDRRASAVLCTKFGHTGVREKDFSATPLPW